MRAFDVQRAAHAAWNRRDFDAMVKDLAQDCIFEDMGRGLSVKGPEEFRAWAADWAKAFSTAKLDPEYIDGGEWSIARFTVTATNDGPMGPMPATGKAVTMSFCEVAHVNDEGKMDRGYVYYDSLSILVQAGLVEPPSGA
ncbi:MAG: ester cyclase [Actinomycetota bacterium]